MDPLTKRERQVLDLIIAGRSTKATAAELGMAFKTAACHRYRLMIKLGAANTADLVRMTLATNQADSRATEPDPLGSRIAQGKSTLRDSVRALRAELVKSVALHQSARQRLARLDAGEWPEI